MDKQNEKKPTAQNDESSGMVVVSAVNFDSETFSFPAADVPSPTTVTLTDHDRDIIHFAILQS